MVIKSDAPDSVKYTELVSPGGKMFSIDNRLIEMFSGVHAETRNGHHNKFSELDYLKTLLGYVVDDKLAIETIHQQYVAEQKKRDNEKEHIKDYGSGGGLDGKPPTIYEVGSNQVAPINPKEHDRSMAEVRPVINFESVIDVPTSAHSTPSIGGGLGSGIQKA